MPTWWCYNPAVNLATFPLHETMHSILYTYCLTMNRYSFYLKYYSQGDSEQLAYTDPCIHSPLVKCGQRHEQQHCCMHSPDRRNQEMLCGLQKQVHVEWSTIVQKPRHVAIKQSWWLPKYIRANPRLIYSMHAVMKSEPWLAGSNHTVCIHIHDCDTPRVVPHSHLASWLDKPCAQWWVSKKLSSLES